MQNDAIYIGKGDKKQHLLLKRANRHGLIAGATGTGKTVTLQILAEGFSKAGVPVFMADVKGDLSGISQPGTPKPFLSKRATQVELDSYDMAGFPAVFWDVYGKQGTRFAQRFQTWAPYCWRVFWNSMILRKVC